MKRQHLTIALICYLLIGCTKTDTEILKKTITEINTLKKVEFKAIFEVSNALIGNGPGLNDTALCYFDFESKDSLIGARYQIVDNYKHNIYNGNEIFEVDEDTKRILYTDKPRKKDVTSSIFMMNSLWSIKKLLPKLIKDSTVTIVRQKDKYKNGENNYAFNFKIKDRYIGIGAILTECKGDTSSYNLLISKKTFLPTELRTNLKHGDMITSMLKYNKQAQRADTIWDYNNYDLQYQRMSKKEFFNRKRNKSSLINGHKVSDWKLPILEKNDSVQLSKIDSKLVLLEFWFKGCGGCRRAIPEINRIQDIYSSKGLRVLGIEYSKSEKGLEEYTKRYGVKYETLCSGKEVANQYGILGAPTFILIDKNGVILFTSAGLRKNELINTIEKYL